MPTPRQLALALGHDESFARDDFLSGPQNSAALALIAVVLRKKAIPKMDALGARIQSNPMDAIPGFRRAHITAIAINVVQLVAIVWSLSALRL